MSRKSCRSSASIKTFFPVRRKRSEDGGVAPSKKKLNVDNGRVSLHIPDRGKVPLLV